MTVSARGCYTRSGRAEVETHEPEFDGISAFEFSFTARLPPGAVDPRANVDRRASPTTGTRAPQFDVFYPWKFDPVPYGAPKPPELPYAEQPCTKWAASKISQIPAFSGQPLFDPDGDAAELTPKLFGEQGFPTLPQTPAWPAP